MDDTVFSAANKTIVLTGNLESMHTTTKPGRTPSMDLGSDT